MVGIMQPVLLVKVLASKPEIFHHSGARIILGRIRAANGQQVAVAVVGIYLYHLFAGVDDLKVTAFIGGGLRKTNRVARNALDSLPLELAESLTIVYRFQL